MPVVDFKARAEALQLRLYLETNQVKDGLLVLWDHEAAVPDGRRLEARVENGQRFRSFGGPEADLQWWADPVTQ
eukprot:3635103-Pleurochrysis_carterae.AAC.2